MVLGGIRHRQRDMIVVVLTQRVRHDRNVHEATMAAEAIMAAEATMVAEATMAAEAIMAVEDREAGAMEAGAEARFAAEAPTVAVSGESRRGWLLTVMQPRRSGHGYFSIAP
jgi:hypothetical protein